MKKFNREFPFLAWTVGHRLNMSVQSLAQSVPGRSFQSPFSHLDLFGREHPSCAALSSNKASEALLTRSSKSVIEKRKPKGSRTKKKSHSSKTHHSTLSTSNSSSKKKGSRKSSKSTSAPSDRTHAIKSKSSVSSTSTMAPVDSDRSSQSLPIRQPKVRRDSVDSPQKTQTIENEKVKTRYSRCSSQPPASLPSTLTSSTTTNPLSDQLIAVRANLASCHHQSDVAAKGEGLKNSTSNEQTTMIPKHLSHSRLSTSAYVLKLSTSNNCSPSTAYPLTSASHTSSSTSSPCSFPSSSHPAAKSSTVNVRLHSRAPHHNIGVRSYRTNSRTPLDRRAKEVGGVEGIARDLKHMRFQQVIVMSGAGISTASGIPDFRTPGTGLYDNLQQYDIPDPTAIFDITYFSHSPKAFYTLAKELYPGQFRPNLAHYFVRLLQDKKVLLRNYTQNIDGLERIAGVQAGKLVEAHGSFSSASCIQCRTKQDPTQVKAAILESKVPRCKHKHCYGLVKPDIVFFGEDLPDRFHSLQRQDFSKCDLLIVMGTSLEVEPFASLVSLARPTVPRLLLNRELVGPFKQHRRRPSDFAVTGDLVEGVRDLARGASWEAHLLQLQGKTGDGSCKVSRIASLVTAEETSAEGSKEAHDGNTTELQPPERETDREKSFGEEEVDKKQSLETGSVENSPPGHWTEGIVSDQADSEGTLGKTAVLEVLSQNVGVVVSAAGQDDLVQAMKELDIEDSENTTIREL